MRGRQEHHTMKIDDFETNINDTGVEYFTFAEKRTKTRNTGMKPSVRQSIPTMFATGGGKCIVQIFKTYVSQRPETLRDSGPFYLQPLSNPRGRTWFKRVPLGENTIGKVTWWIRWNRSHLFLSFVLSRSRQIIQLVKLWLKSYRAMEYRREKSEPSQGMQAPKAWIRTMKAMDASVFIFYYLSHI